MKKKKQLPERDFFFGVLCTLYPKEMNNLIKAAYLKRNTHYKAEHEEMIELTTEAKQIIDDVLAYKSKLSLS